MKITAGKLNALIGTIAAVVAVIESVAPGTIAHLVNLLPLNLQAAGTVVFTVVVRFLIQRAKEDAAAEAIADQAGA